MKEKFADLIFVVEGDSVKFFSRQKFPNFLYNYVSNPQIILITNAGEHVLILNRKLKFLLDTDYILAVTIN